MREKMRSNGPSSAAGRRDITAGIGHQHDQRRLAHEGGFAAHVRAGDDQDVALLVHHQVVGHEGCFADLFDHRVAPAADRQPGVVAKAGAAQIEALGALGKAAQHVESGDAVRAVLQRGQGRHQRFEQLLVQHLLALQCALACRQHLVLEGLEFRRDEALGALERLAADVIVRRLVRFAAADLDVIAVHPVVADLERVDAGALALALFQIDQELVGVLRQVAQLVQLAVEAGRQHPAIAQHHRRVFEDRTAQQVERLGVFGDVGCKRLQAGVFDIAAGWPAVPAGWTGCRATPRGHVDARS